MTKFDATVTAEAANLLNREAYLLDRRQWDDWLALYTKDAVYWAPAFASEDEMTSDPDNDVSLMYMDRNGLAARMFRVESGDSYASDPLPWTAHLVTNILVTDGRDDEIDASATWLVHSFSRVYGSIQRGGLYDYTLRREGDDLRIAAKKIMIFDDRITGPLDFYNI